MQLPSVQNESWFTPRVGIFMWVVDVKGCKLHKNILKKTLTVWLLFYHLFNSKIIKSTGNFFGLGDCDEQHANLQRKWTQRRKRHYHKRYGALLDPDDVVDGIPGRHGAAGSISSYQSSRQADPNLMRTLSRRESVASLAWKKVKKMKDDPTVICLSEVLV